MWCAPSECRLLRTPTVPLCGIYRQLRRHTKPTLHKGLSRPRSIPDVDIREKRSISQGGILFERTLRRNLRYICLVRNAYFLYACCISYASRMRSLPILVSLLQPAPISHRAAAAEEKALCRASLRQSDSYRSGLIGKGSPRSGLPRSGSLCSGLIGKGSPRSGPPCTSSPCSG